MASAAATRTSTDARTRSLELAEARGETACSWSARTLGWSLDEQSGALVSLSLEIASATSDAVYSVTYDAASDDACCTCRSAQYGRPCHHRGLACTKGRAVARLYAPAGRAEAARAYQRDLATEGNARALG